MTPQRNHRTTADAVNQTRSRHHTQRLAENRNDENSDTAVLRASGAMSAAGVGLHGVVKHKKAEACKNRLAGMAGRRGKRQQQDGAPCSDGNFVSSGGYCLQRPAQPANALFNLPHIHRGKTQPQRGEVRIRYTKRRAQPALTSPPAPAPPAA